MDFEFNKQLAPQNSISVDNIGEFGLEAWNDAGYYYYLVVKTIMGSALIASCGPVIPDVDILPSGFRMDVSKMSYKEDKLGRTISYFLNDGKKGITDARIIDIDDAILSFPDVRSYLKYLDEETI